MQGSAETLCRVQSMVMEYAPYILRHAGAELPEFLGDLKKHFSKIYRIDQNSLVRTNVQEILSQEEAVDLLFEK
jgi:hypothetical protein